MIICNSYIAIDLYFSLTYIIWYSFLPKILDDWFLINRCLSNSTYTTLQAFINSKTRFL